MRVTISYRFVPCGVEDRAGDGQQGIETLRPTQVRIQNSRDSRYIKLVLKNEQIVLVVVVRAVVKSKTVIGWLIVSVRMTEEVKF